MIGNLPHNGPKKRNIDAKQRKCLKCQRYFKSDGNHNRICNDHKEELRKQYHGVPIFETFKILTKEE